MGKTIFFRFLKTFVNSFISGIVLGLMCFGFLFSAQGIIGYLCLGSGLLISMLYGYDNFLVSLTMVMENKIPEVLKAVVSLFGNFLGIIILALLINLIDNGFSANYVNTLKQIEESILSFDHLQVLILAFASGVIIYFGINTYKKAEQPIARFLVLFVCSALVTYLGNFIFPFFSFYLGMFNFNMNIFAKFFTLILGNALGVLLIPLLRYVRGRIKSNG